MIISIRIRLQMARRMAVCNLMKYQIFVYTYFSFVFSQFSLSAAFMKLVASNLLSQRYFESSEIGLLFRQICGAATIVSEIAITGGIVSRCHLTIFASLIHIIQLCKTDTLFHDIMSS